MIWPTLPVEQLKSKVTVGYSNRYNQCTRPLTSNSPYKPNQRPLPPPGPWQTYSCTDSHRAFENT